MYDSEKTVVGTILVDSRALAVVRPLLSLEDFKTTEGQAVFRAACSLEDEGLTPDPVLIRDRAAEQGEQLTNDVLADVMSCVTASSNLPAHAQAMKNFGFRAKLLDVISDAQGKLLLEKDPHSVYVELQTGLEQSVEREGGARLIDSETALSDFYDLRDSIDNGQRRAFVPTGFTALDNALGGGFVPGSLNILAARPGCGKTTTALQIADKAAASGIQTLFVSMEMETTQLTAKRIAVESGVSANALMLHQLTDDEYKKVAEAADTLQKRPLFISDRRSVAVGDIGVAVRQIKGCGLAVVDYMGLLRYEQGRTLYESVTRTSNELKRLARALKIPILCLCQLNREVEARKGSPPRLSDLRDSGAIEQDADSVLLLHQLEGDGVSTLICNVAKNRHGSAGADVEFAWQKKTGKLFPTRHERQKYA